MANVDKKGSVVIKVSDKVLYSFLMQKLEEIKDSLYIDKLIIEFEELDLITYKM